MLFLSVNWPHVWLVTIVGFLMVILLLVVLIFFLKIFGVIMQPRVKSVKPKQAVCETVAVSKDENTEDMTLTANAMAAIAMSLRLYYNGVHDEEPTQVTIKNVERRYSPWNSKLYGMNNLHR